MYDVEREIERVIYLNVHLGSKVFIQFYLRIIYRDEVIQVAIIVKIYETFLQTITNGFNLISM